MITAERLTTLTSFTPKALAVALAQSGYTGCAFKTAKFIGITNGGQFCYKVTFHDEEGMDEDAQGKVYVKYNTQDHSITADF